MNQSARHLQPISIEDYLAGEATARDKHEYIDGFIFVMAGGSYVHNLISNNVTAELHAQLKGTDCRSMNSDNKVRINLGSTQRMYYPDAMVACGDNIMEQEYQDHPSVIVEVLSRSTRKMDEIYKREDYQRIETLTSYILLEQDFPAAIVYRRTIEGFVRSVVDDPLAVISLPEIHALLSLENVYAEVPFKSPEELRELEEQYELGFMDGH